MYARQQTLATHGYRMYAISGYRRWLTLHLRDWSPHQTVVGSADTLHGQSDLAAAIDAPRTGNVGW
jgi:hypothetical protein